VTAAFLMVFTLVGIPLAFGATLLTRAMPWAAILVGAALAAVGVAQLLGRHVSVPLPSVAVVAGDRRLSSFFLFGVAYAVSSLGCTLPVFLSAVGSSLTASGPLAALGVFLAYGAGMGTLVIALSISAALLQGGLASSLRRTMPYVSRLTGAFLLVVGVYLIAYWASALAGSVLPRSPVLEVGARASSAAETWLGGSAGRWFVASAAALILGSLA